MCFALFSSYFESIVPFGLMWARVGEFQCFCVMSTELGLLPVNSRLLRSVSLFRLCFSANVGADVVSKIFTAVSQLEIATTVRNELNCGCSSR